MADILTASDIAELRRDWIVDEFEDAPEWGQAGAAKVAAGASVGALSMSITGLGSGSLSRGTRFSVTSGNRTAEYAVHDDVAIDAGTATVALDRPLVYTATTNDPVAVVREEVGMVARVLKRRQFSDIDIENFARRAEERWGVAIHNARDTKTALYSAIGALAIDAKLDSPLHYSAVIQHEAQDGGRSFFERLEKKKAQYLAALGRDPNEKRTGPMQGSLTR